MVRPAYGKNGGVFIDILSRVTVSDYYKILLTQKYLLWLYEYAFYFMYKTYRLLSRSEQKKYMTVNIKDRDNDLIDLFNRDIFSYKHFVVKDVPVLENSTIYKESIYITPDSIQNWIKYRIIWFAGMDCYTLLPEFERWKHGVTTTPNTLKKKIGVFIRLSHSDYNRAYIPSVKDSYIPQMQMKAEEVRRYIHHVTPSAGDIDPFTNRLEFKTYDIGRYHMPVVGAELVAYLKRDVDELWRYLYQCDHKLYHTSIKTYVEPTYLQQCVTSEYKSYDNVDNIPENQLTKFVMLNLHLVPKDKNNNIRTLMYKPNKMRELEDRYLEQKGIEFNEYDKTIPGYYG